MIITPAAKLRPMEVKDANGAVVAEADGLDAARYAARVLILQDGYDTPLYLHLAGDWKRLVRVETDAHGAIVYRSSDYIRNLL